jgi:hypothetical protein
MLARKMFVRRNFIRKSLPSVAVISTLAACTSDTVDLGGGTTTRQTLQQDSRCIESPILQGDALVTTQSELDALGGCEEITGDLIIDVFADASLSPLAALRAVGGSLQLGAFPQPPGSYEWEPEQHQALRAEVDAILADGYLPSLEGVDSLQRAGNLEISYVAAVDLTAFESLLSLNTHHDSALAGRLTIRDTALVSLEGLEEVTGISDVILVDNPALEDIGSLTLSPRLANVNILNSPQLVDLSALAPITSLNTLTLVNLGVVNLDALINLGQVELDINLQENPKLANVDRLGQLYFVGGLTVTGNPVLTSLPPLANLSTIDYLMILGNAELRSIAVDLPPRPEEYYVQGRPIQGMTRSYDIGDNPKLETLSLAKGLELAQHVAIYENPALTRIDLGTLTSLDRLSIDDNASLIAVQFDALTTVDALSVTNNPLLAVDGFQSVRTFETILSDNAAPTTAP